MKRIMFWYQENSFSSAIRSEFIPIDQDTMQNYNIVEVLQL
jgi:hypothetical protein